ncbi:MAG: TIGR04282 family arsenosugar biosynthesis glycosyltransferase [Acidobacteria bacterium]|nr:TIGR04282 family arsenosugar biosynthesis glycosyltransferase [Acidobacteriota bacterium]
MSSTYAILDPSAPSAQKPGGCALAMMIKAPRAGASKTRLVPPLTPEEAASLSVCFLSDTAENIAAACAASEGGASGVAVYTPVGAESAFDGLLPAGFALLAQRGDTFGARLANAADDLLAAGFDSACLIDSDSPTLPTGALASAVAELARPGDRVVLGPADDGGYYLIGLKGARRRVFEDIDWSTERVLAQTIERAAECGLGVGLLPAWYDVDDAATLARLCAELFAEGDAPACPPGGPQFAGYAAAHTRGYLARVIESEGRARIWPDAAPAAAAGAAGDDAGGPSETSARAEATT